MLTLKTAFLVGLLFVAASKERSRPEAIPRIKVSATYTNLLDTAGESKGSVVVWGSQTGKVKVLDGYQVWQWSNAWNGLVLVRDSSVYRWDSSMSTPRKVIDVAALVSSPLYAVPGVLACCVDHAGQFLAVKTEDGFAVIDLRTKMVTRRFTLDKIGRAIHNVLVANVWYCGIAYSPKNWLAVSIPTKRWKASTDGCGPAQCLVISPNGRMRSLGLGTPVAWISDDAVLCLREDSDSDRVSPEVLFLSGGKTRTSKHRCLQIGWDGTNVLLAKKHSLEVLSPDLAKRIAILPFPAGILDDRGPVVGIPSRAISSTGM